MFRPFFNPRSLVLVAVAAAQCCSLAQAQTSNPYGGAPAPADPVPSATGSAPTGSAPTGSGNSGSGQSDPLRSTAPRPDPTRRGARRLSPQEERERAIRKFDPKSSTDPIDREQDTGLLSPSGQLGPEGASKTTRPTPPLPGSVAASQQQQDSSLRTRASQGPRILDSEAETSSAQEYSGPAVLSRSYTLSSPSVSNQLKWAPYFSFGEVYETGIPKYAAAGPPVFSSAQGTTASWGLSGQHLWKRQQISFSYRGNLSRYIGAEAYNGSNHSLNLRYGRILTRRLIFSLTESASSTTQSQSLLSPLLPLDSSVANVNLALSPVLQPVDLGIRQFASAPSLIWQKSSRTSVTLGGAIFFADRTGSSQGGTTGTQAQAEVTHRLSRKTTIGSYYSYTHYLFSKHVSESDSHTLGGILSYSFNRSTELRLRLGATQVETQSLTFVSFPLELVPLLGQTGGIAVDHRLSRFEDVSAEIARDLGRNKTIRASYAKGLAPGNGTILTSSRESWSGTFAMLVHRTYRINAGYLADRLTSIGTAGMYSSRAFQAAVTRPYSHSTSISFGVDVRSLNLPGTDLRTQQLRFSTTISWSPQEGAVWK